MDAEKIKKKLNGSILKGNKMRVEEAKKDDKPDLQSPEADGAAENEEIPKLRKSDRKRKREDNVQLGVELPDERRVKRGWTEPGKEKKHKKSKKEDKTEKKKKSPASAYTDKEELLFKTKLPLNIPEPQKSKDKKNKKRKGDREVVVHEFENTTKHPSFLRSGNAAADTMPVTEYDEKKGWINEDGKVVEPARLGRRKATSKAIPTLKPSEPTAPKPVEDETSSSGSSSSSEDEESSASRASPLPTSAPISPSEAVPDNATPSAVDTEPHPLETLFKKPKTPSSKPNLEVKIPFTFFGTDEPENENHSSTIMTGVESARKTPGKLPSLNIPIPQTPFTQRDMHWRGQRSAAPTPDTAAPSKLGFGSLWGRRTSRSDSLSPEDEEQDEDGLEDVAEGDGGEDSADDEAGEGGGKKDEEESKHVKGFYENRGATNRAWKKSKRGAAKEKRQRENKRRGGRA